MLFAFFPYGGSGGTSIETPAIRTWFARTSEKAKADSRVGSVFAADFSDTPITMTRSQSVITARKVGADILVMCDSDMHPDLYLGEEPEAKPFWDSCFDFVYNRKMEGKVTVVAAPYCGPPPRELPYIFQWSNYESEHPNCDCRIEMYTREQAAFMSGIHPAAALPTGLIMFDMEIFEVTDPKHEYAALKERYGHTIATQLTKPWFYYEWKDIYAAEKGSTEDVTVSRDMNLLATMKLGYSPVFANWDCWAGHYKPKCVGKPKVTTTEMVNDKFAEAVRAERRGDVVVVDVANLNRGKKPALPALETKQPKVVTQPKSVELNGLLIHAEE